MVCFIESKLFLQRDGVKVRLLSSHHQGFPDRRLYGGGAQTKASHLKWVRYPKIRDSIPTDVDTTVNANLSGNIVNRLIGGLSSLRNGSQTIVLQVNLDGKTIAQTVFEPSRHRRIRL